MKHSDPYRLFFPLGILLGLAGVAIWPIVYLGWLQGYWGSSHAFLQADGFLFSFIAGFLLTAVPRFTSTTVPSHATQWTLAGCIIIGSVCLELQEFQLGQIAFVAAYAMLVILIIRRFITRQSTPPETFPLIGIGIAAGFLGTIINALAAWDLVSSGWLLTGKRALTEGMTLLLVLGVGGFLGPRLMGFERLPVIGVQMDRAKKQLLVPRGIPYLAAGILILLSIPLEYGFSITWMVFVRATVATLVMIRALEPWRLPTHRTTLSWCVWTANLLILIGLWMAAIFPIYRIDFLHILFIGGFTLLILAVGMRVTLSHGGHGLASEHKNWVLRIGLTAGLIAMLARVGAPFSQSYTDHLALAAALWIFALTLWGIRILKLLRSS